MDYIRRENSKCYDDYRQAAYYLRCDVDEAESEYNKNHKQIH